MSTAAEKLDKDQRYTYADYLEWDEEVRAEIINGKVNIIRAPRTIHQIISMRLFQCFTRFLEDKTCEVFAAPFGVRLFPKEDKSDNTVVEPDLVVICDPTKIDERGCNGAPDLIIEILYPYDQQRERIDKFNIYLKAGVREYWLVYPENKWIEVNLFSEGQTISKAYGINEPNEEKSKLLSELVPVSVLSGLEIDTKDIFV